MQLRDLGIFGFGAIEDALVASLVTGDPLLLVGRHGAAKTLTARRVAQALGLRFHAYDASKALFEDVLGFPDPRRLADGVLDYVPTSIAIWDKEFVLIDELSRATPQLQSKWLEVVRSRRLMGKEAKQLRFVWAAMNPPDAAYGGAQPLDDALLGRFAFVLQVPEVHDLSEGDQRAVVAALGDDDAPELRRAKGGHGDTGGNGVGARAQAGRLLLELVDAARSDYRQVDAAVGARADAYVLAVATSLRLAGRGLDGRRLGFIRRNLVALLAVRQARSHASGESAEIAAEAIDDAFLDALRASVPFAAEERPPASHVVDAAHFSALRLLAGKDAALTVRARVLLARGPLAIAQRYIEHAGALPVADRPDALTRIETDLHGARDPRTVAEVVIALKLLLASPGALSPSMARRAARRYRELCGPQGDPQMRRVRNPYHHAPHRERRALPPAPPPDAPWARRLAHRVALALANLEPEPPIEQEGEPLVEALAAAFEALGKRDRPRLIERVVLGTAAGAARRPGSPDLVVQLPARRAAEPMALQTLVAGAVNGRPRNKGRGLANQARRAS